MKKQAGATMLLFMMLILVAAGAAWLALGGFGPAQPTVDKSVLPLPKATVHVMSVHDAGDGGIFVKANVVNATLLLFSHEAVHWRVNAQGKALKRIFAVGQHPPLVTLVNGSVIETVIMSPEQLSKAMGEDIAIPDGQQANDLAAADAIARTLAGKGPDTYQYARTGSRFEIEPHTPRFTFITREGGMIHSAPPAGDAPATSNAPPLPSDLPAEAVRDILAMHAWSAPVTESASKLAYSSGKIYFEGTIRAGSDGADPFTNIGLCLASDAGVSSLAQETMAIQLTNNSNYVDGDVIGVAADLDAHKVYFRANGTWLNGNPAGKGGAPLVKDRPYRACFRLSGKTSEEDSAGGASANTSWEINLGARPFHMPPPRGFAPYQH